MAVVVRVLGPLEVLRDGRDVTPAAAKQRVVLAALALAAGRPVPVTQLVDDVWGESPVGSARKTLQAYVARLRETVGDGVIRTAAAGYRLDTGLVQLDHVEFDDAIRAAAAAERKGDAEATVRSLRAGLASWRGEPLTNVPSESLRQRAAASLVERRLQAAERCCDLEVALGRADDAVPELRALVDEHPLRERTWASLLRALYASGRQADALAAYREATTLLADQLGVDPGTELQQVHQEILTQTLPVPPAAAATTGGHVDAPRQLPARPTGFVGREQQLDRLVSWLDDPERTPVAVVAGPPGVGKSALAVTVGHLLAERFPDGQLFVDVRGFSTEQPLRAGDVLPRFLRALGVGGEQVPADVDEQAALYRSRMSGRRVLVVVDNAASPDVVRPLLPGAAGCAALVTSRNQLRPLVAVEGAHLLPLDMLSTTEARLSLAAQVGEGRLAAEDDAVGRLVELCGRLPLALRIVGAHLATHPHETVDDHVAQLDMGGRLLSLWAGSEAPLVTAAFATSYTALDDDARRLFRQLGAAPGTDISADAVAALTGCVDPRRELDALSAASLLDQHAPGRYRMHDLVRDYARERAEHDDDAASRSAARRRLFDWYIAMVDAALVQLRGYHRLARPQLSVRATGTPDLDWLEAELPNLVMAVEDAARHGPPECSWHLADALRPYLEIAVRYQEWLAVVSAALPAAEQHGDARARAAMHGSLGGLRAVLGDPDEAVREMTRAQELYAEAEDGAGEAHTWQNLGIVHAKDGRLTHAHLAFERAIEVATAYGDSHRYLANLQNLGHLKAEMGQLTRALSDLRHVLEIHERQASGTRHLAIAHDNLAIVLRRLGDLRAAAAHLETAMCLDAELGLDAEVAYCRHELARVHCDQGAYEQAAAEADVALVAARELDLRRLELDARTTAAEVELRAGRPVDDTDALAALSHDAIARAEPRLEARILEVLAWTHVARREYPAALTVAERELALGTRLSMRLVQDPALTVSTAALVGLDRPDDAVERGVEALRRHRETGYRLHEARTLCWLGDAYGARGDRDLAVECWTRACGVYTEIGTAEVTDARRRLTAASPPSSARRSPR